MSGDPILARRSRRNAAKGGELGLPNNCQLGSFRSHGECGENAFKKIGNVRVCRHHWKLAMQIKRASLKAPDIAPRHPETRIFRRTA